MGRLKGHMVYKIIATEFLPLRERPLRDPEEDSYLSLLRNFLKSSPLYFSYSIDITSAFQRQAHSDALAPLWKRADDRFFWNRFVQSDLIELATSLESKGGLRHGQQQGGVDPFILPVMFGMMRITTTRINSTPVTFILITRRSRHRAGTRYFTRGIDEQGHVANYNETEQVVIINDSSGQGGFSTGNKVRSTEINNDSTLDLQIMSYVQTRGSVPAFWAEVNTLHYVPNLQIRGIETAVDAAKKHFDEQIHLYGDNYLVNLVNQRGRESRVKQAYEQVMQALISSPSEATQADQITNEKLRVLEPGQRKQKYDQLHYVYFDFHNETKGLKWHRALLLLDQLKPALTQGQYFRGADQPGDTQGRLEIRNEQTAVVRTNCMDCLDRTNVVQTMLGRWTLTRQLTDVGILRPGQSADDDETFRDLFRNMWADNADVVSKSYSGTGALKTDFTRTGERTRVGMARDFSNSMTRYIMNNFADGPRQDGFDLFLGVFLPSPSSVHSQALFKDRRPILVQSLPYLLTASLFFVSVASLARPQPGLTVWPLRVFSIMWMIVGSWCFHFIYNHGMLYVSPMLSQVASIQLR